MSDNLSVLMLRLHALLRARRRRLALIAAVLTLSGGLLAAHSVVGESHMGLLEPVAMCLAVLDTAAVAVVAVARVTQLVPWAPLVLVPAPAPALPTRVPRSRAGPAVLQVFLR